MLSGNGRHRRPRQAPALLVAAGVTGSAIAIPLLGASGASAADGTVWDKVAECETGGSWSAEGGGEYGGLSLTQEDWEAYGGLDYAPRADKASRNQQIAVAQKVLAGEGVRAWGACGVTAGLTKENGSVDVDTGVADDSSAVPGLSDLSKGSSGSSDSSSDASSSSGSSDASASPTGEPSSSSSSSDAGDGSGKSDASPSVDPGTGGAQSTDSSPTANPEAENSDNSGQSVGSWSLVDTGAIGGGRHRGAPAEESADTTTQTTAPDTSYVVRGGDTLASIADSLDVSGGWHALYDRNKGVIGEDPSRIVPGQTLSVGAE